MDTIVYIDRSDVHDMASLKAGIPALVDFVDAHQPQMAHYAFYLDEEANTMAVVSVHPNSASLERHVEIGPFLTLREIEVFGHLSERAAELVRQKAATLGDGGRVILHEQFSGFAR